MLFAFYGNIKICISLYRRGEKILLVNTSYRFLSFNNRISTTSLIVMMLWKQWFGYFRDIKATDETPL
jgi:hypothetical protein